jgi:hypothetical protein
MLGGKTRGGDAVMPKANALTSGESIKSSQCVCESGESCTRPMQSRRAEGRIAHDRCSRDAPRGQEGSHTTDGDAVATLHE